MIGTYVTKPLPALIEAAAGSRAVTKIFSTADVPETVHGALGGFMPQRNLFALLEAAARVLGRRDLGLLYGPHLDVADWGTWGAYVRGAATLEGALSRTGRAMRYHVSLDTLTLELRGDEAFFVHRAALASINGYPHYAACAASAMISLVRAFAGATWRPMRVEVDLPRPGDAGAWEDLFQCPVVFGKPDLAVVLPRELLTTPRLARPASQAVTLADLRRLVSEGMPRTFVDEITQTLRLRLLDGESDIEGLACQLALGPRTIQRNLREAGTSYRELLARVRIERALELLSESDIPVLEISAELGYSAPPHFARAFRRALGLSPNDVRHARGGGASQRLA